MRHEARCALLVLGWLWGPVGCTDSGDVVPVDSSAGQGGGGGVSASAGGAGSTSAAIDAAPAVEDASSEVLTRDDGRSEAADALLNADAVGEAGTAAGTIVPLYTSPSDVSWNAIVTAKKAHPSVAVVAIVNPSSGPGNRVDGSYTTGLDRLLAASVVPIGYVSTDYGRRGRPAVEADIDQWLAFYPKIQGIFFDEQSNVAADVAFYRDVAQYAKGKGLALTVGNPGTSVPAGYLDTVDVMLVYEDAGWPPLQRLNGHAAQRQRYGIIPYAAPLDTAIVAAARAEVGYVYATSDTLPNPWDSLTPYFDDLLGVLSR